MIRFITYSKNITPSSIDGSGGASDAELALLQETDEFGVIILDEDQEVSEATHMVQDGKIILRPTHGVAVDVSGKVVALSDLPAEPYGLFVDMGEPVGLVPVSETEFELTDPGDYAIVVRPAFPYAEERHDVAIE